MDIESNRHEADMCLIRKNTGNIIQVKLEIIGDTVNFQIFLLASRRHIPLIVIFM